MTSMTRRRRSGARRMATAEPIAARRPAEAPALPPVIADWFAGKDWQPRRHQKEMLAAARAGRNALLVAPTGAGKTLAGFIASLAELIEAPTEGQIGRASCRERGERSPAAE